jgi:hypothetical protein
MKEKFWWITTSDKGHMKTLSCINGDADKENMTKNIYFKSKKEADDFLEKMQKFIVDNYPRAKEENWFKKK